MQLVHFCLGYRFQNELSTETIFNLLFDTVPCQNLLGCRVLLATPPEDEVMPYQSKIIVLDGFPLSQARKAHTNIQNCLPWMGALASDTPVLEKNYLVHCTQVADLGTVQQDGTLMGGTDRFGEMRFALQEASKLTRKDRYLVLGSQEDCILTARKLVCHKRAGSLSTLELPDGGKGLVTSLVRNLSGRYVSCPAGGYIGMLPEGAAVVDEDWLTDQPTDSCILGKRALTALERGALNIYLPFAVGLQSDGGEGFFTVLEEAYPDGIPADCRFYVLCANENANSQQFNQSEFQALSLFDTVFSWFALKNKVQECTHLILPTKNFATPVQDWLSKHASKGCLSKVKILNFDPETRTIQ